jgi:hypothetical protein
MEKGCAWEGRMDRKLRVAPETVLFLFLFMGITGLWAYLWLPPF